MTDTILEEYKFHNSYQCHERQIFEGKVCIFITSCKLTKKNNIQLTVFS